jgi:hypothetical protein
MDCPDVYLEAFWLQEWEWVSEDCHKRSCWKNSIGLSVPRPCGSDVYVCSKSCRLCLTVVCWLLERNKVPSWIEQPEYVTIFSPHLIVLKPQRETFYTGVYFYIKEVPVWNSGTERSSGMVYRHTPANFKHYGRMYIEQCLLCCILFGICLCQVVTTWHYVDWCYTCEWHEKCTSVEGIGTREGVRPRSRWEDNIKMDVRGRVDECRSLTKK